MNKQEFIVQICNCLHCRPTFTMQRMNLDEIVVIYNSLRLLSYDISKLDKLVDKFP